MFGLIAHASKIILDDKETFLSTFPDSKEFLLYFKNWSSLSLQLKRRDINCY